jgi:hypothetical protein
LKEKFTPADFLDDDKLYRGFRKNELDNMSKIQVDTIRFPDFLCNWSRFSSPKDIREREGGRPTDGCFSVAVETARYKKMATTCHEPLENNYSHSEVRQLHPNEDIFTEPPKGRKLEKERDGWARKDRLAYRQNLTNNLTVELDALA